LLHVGVEAQIVAGGIDDALGFGELDEAGRFVGAGGERLFADDVFAGVNGVAGDRKVGVVGGADVNSVDRRIGEQMVVVADGPQDADLLAESLCHLVVLVGDGDKLGIGLAADVFDMDAADEAGADYGDLNFGHGSVPLYRFAE
jgi:hypothetical protein